MQLPLGYQTADSKLVYTLNKSFDGIKQVSRPWFAKTGGRILTVTVPSLFTLKTGDGFVAVVGSG